MPTGWFVREPPSFGALVSAIKKPTASMQGSQPEFGPLYSQLKKPTASMTGKADPAGAMASTLKKRTMVATGAQTQVGTMGVSLKKPTFFSTPQATGTMQASVKKTAAVMNGNQPFTGVVGASLKKAIAQLTTAHTQAGTMSSTLKKRSAAITAKTSMVAYTAPFTVPPAGLVNVRSGGSNDITVVSGNLREGSTGSSAFTYHVGILPDEFLSMMFSSEVTLAAANTNDRGVGGGAANADGSKIVFCYLPGDSNAGAIWTRIGTTWTSRATKSGVQATALGDKVKLVPSVDGSGVVTWTVYKNGVATALTWTDSTHLVDLPGTHPVMAFRHYDSSGTNYYSPGISEIRATEI